MKFLLLFAEHGRGSRRSLKNCYLAFLGCLLACLGRSWALLRRDVVLIGASWVLQGPPEAKKRPPGSIWGALLFPQMMIFITFYIVSHALLLDVLLD